MRPIQIYFYDVLNIYEVLILSESSVHLHSHPCLIGEIVDQKTDSTAVGLAIESYLFLCAFLPFPGAVGERQFCNSTLCTS